MTFFSVLFPLLLSVGFFLLEAAGAAWEDRRRRAARRTPWRMTPQQLARENRRRKGRFV